MVLVFFSFLARISFFDSGEMTLLNSIKALFSPLVNFYLLAFQDPNTSLLLFLSIVISCFFCLYWIYFKKYLPLSKRLDFSLERAKVVQETIESKELEPMIALFEIENDEFLKKAILKFKKNTLSKNDFPNVNMLETKGFPLKIISALPGYFVGLGLVFTFLGLVAALFFAAQGMKSGNYEAAKTSLMQLLHASSFKFTTSIAGVSSSLLISILYKSLLHSLHLKISMLENIIDNIFTSIKTDSVKPEVAPVENIFNRQSLSMTGIN